MEDNVKKGMYMCMCDWVSLLYYRKLTEHRKPAIMEKKKTIKKKKKKKKRLPGFNTRLYHLLAVEP